MSEGPSEGRPTRGKRSPQLKQELDAYAAMEAEGMADTVDDSPELVGESFVRYGHRLLLKASIPYQLHGDHGDSSYFTTALEGHINDGEDLGAVYDEMREIVLEANIGLAGAAQEKLDELREQARRTPIRPR